MDKSIKLGYAFEIVVTTPDVKQSLPFYEKLGYQKLTETDAPAPRALLTDGLILLALREDSKWKGSLTYYAETVAEKVAALEKSGVRFDNKQETGGKITTATLVDPNGFELTLVQAAPSEVPKLPGKPVSRLGQFGELSIETEDVAKSLEFWLKLGFEPTEYMPAQPNEWASIKDDLLMLGIYRKGHCPHVIRTPSITYFNADAAERNRKFKQEGMQFIQEPRGANGDAIAEAPEGQLFFLFGF